MVEPRQREAYQKNLVEQGQPNGNYRPARTKQLQSSLQLDLPTQSDYPVLALALTTCLGAYWRPIPKGWLGWE